ncbi:hypothetical protein IJ076_01110 [Candidatus Saccharibacteria bacterium]|nr:hypothetical protein [Candidatus Saccharibacteria bacterium]
MARKRMPSALVAMSVLFGMNAPLIASAGNVSAYWRGGEISGDDGQTLSEIYIEIGDQAGLDDAGITEPADSVSVRKTLSDTSIIGYDENEDNRCIISGKKVGRATAICEYLDEDENVIYTNEVTVHVFADPNADANPATGEHIDVYLPTNSSVKLSDLVSSYFDNPEEIKVANWTYDDEEESQPFTIIGEYVSDAVIMAGDEAWADDVYFYNPFSGGYYDGPAEMIDSNDEFARLYVQVYEEPYLENLYMSAYGTEDVKTRHYEIEDTGNLPFYEISSSDENIVSVSGDCIGGFTFEAHKPGEVTMTIHYHGDNVEDQSFLIIVTDTPEDDDSYTTEIESKTVNASTLTDEEKSAYQAMITEGIVLGYYDVELIVKQNGTPVDKISESATTHKITLSFPEEMDLSEVPEGFKRIFYVVRDHNGTKEVLDATDNGDGTFSFYSDKFSTYALFYQEIVDEDYEEEVIIIPDTSADLQTPDTGVVSTVGSASATSSNLVVAILVGVTVSAFSFFCLSKRIR